MALKKDEVVLTLGSESLRITQSYEIRAGIFQQPAGFAIRVGHSGVLARMLAKYPPNTPFSITVNGNPAQSGFTDGFGAGESTGASLVTFKGRDIMGRVTKAYVAREQAFSGLSYAELTEQVLELCGLKGYTRANGKLIASNDANRRKMSGKQIVQTAPPSVDKADFKITGSGELSGETARRTQATREVEGRATGIVTAEDVEVTLFRNEVPGTTKAVYPSIKVTLGTKWYEGFLKVQLDRGGLFLWAGADGAFILSTPNPNQQPAYRIERFLPKEKGQGRVISANYDVDIADRYSKWIVEGRGGGRNHGRGKTIGEYVDPEMAAFLGGDEGSVNNHHDNACDTLKKCQHLARRRASEANRAAWNLTYTVAGHSTEGRTGRATWAQDTMVEVDDRVLGVAGVFYLESLTMNRGPQTTTTIRLMRPGDLLFGELEAA